MGLLVKLISSYFWQLIHYALVCPVSHSTTPIAIQTPPGIDRAQVSQDELAGAMVNV